MTPTEFFININCEKAIEFQIRCGMPASDFLRELYKVQTGKTLDFPDDVLKIYDQQAIEKAKKQNLECGYNKDNIRGLLFSIIMNEKPEKKLQLNEMIANDPLVNEFCRVCPMLRVIINYFSKILNNK